ncbi:hypothetical protein BOTBODRAFT_573706 [Botryobasidium botryosum FD-172 SS1]|uniref:Uncharacterized protein n=1 Tax=Botryobasidium botryosum (strain FD-172 SS1) TaxID=930990 RepID=A0A067MNX3_BOTB1|nr:hypothetical protein BOTBODRAFT_573706 [Botryobasidium botryosum FD-172 SS1]
MRERGRGDRGGCGRASVVGTGTHACVPLSLVSPVRTYFCRCRYHRPRVWAIAAIAAVFTACACVCACRHRARTCCCRPRHCAYRCRHRVYVQVRARSRAPLPPRCRFGSRRRRVCVERSGV